MQFENGILPGESSGCIILRISAIQCYCCRLLPYCFRYYLPLCVIATEVVGTAAFVDATAAVISRNSVAYRAETVINIKAITTVVANFLERRDRGL